MKFHDAVRKHIKTLDGIQKRLKVKDTYPTSLTYLKGLSANEGLMECGHQICLPILKKNGMN